MGKKSELKPEKGKDGIAKGQETDGERTNERFFEVVVLGGPHHKVAYTASLDQYDPHWTTIRLVASNFFEREIKIQTIFGMRRPF